MFFFLSEKNLFAYLDGFLPIVQISEYETNAIRTLAMLLSPESQNEVLEYALKCFIVVDM